MTPQEKRAALIARRKVLQAAGKRLPRKRRPPRQLHPRAIERAYYAQILRTIAPFFTAVKNGLLPQLSHITAARDADLKLDGAAVIRFDASYGEMIGNVFSGIRINVARNITEAAVADVAQRFATRTSDFNRSQVDRQFQAVLGIPVLRQEKWLAAKIQAHVLYNTALISDITVKSSQELQNLIVSRVEAGDSVRTIAKAVEEKLEVTRRRARFIARDQVSKLNGKLTELRQKEAGVEEYIWRSVADGADRATHLANNGKRFRWDDPPATGHPGEDYQCRCTAEPVLDEFVEFEQKKAA